MNYKQFKAFLNERGLMSESGVKAIWNTRPHDFQTLDPDRRAMALDFAVRATLIEHPELRKLDK